MNLLKYQHKAGDRPTAVFEIDAEGLEWLASILANAESPLGCIPVMRDQALELAAELEDAAAVLRAAERGEDD